MRMSGTSFPKSVTIETTNPSQYTYYENVSKTCNGSFKQLHVTLTYTCSSIQLRMYLHMLIINVLAYLTLCIILLTTFHTLLEGSVISPFSPKGSKYRIYKYQLAVTKETRSIRI